MPKSVLKGKIKGEKDKDESKLIISSPEIYLNKDGGGNSNIISNSNTGTSGSGSGSEGKSGTMYMKGKVFKKWKKYWFVLRDRSLSYFKSRFFFCVFCVFFVCFFFCVFFFLCFFFFIVWLSFSFFISKLIVLFFYLFALISFI